MKLSKHTAHEEKAGKAQAPGIAVVVVVVRRIGSDARNNLRARPPPAAAKVSRCKTISGGIALRWQHTSS
jgi:hypothetical protein